MASTYSPNLRLELIGTGEQQGTWGSTTNTNLGTLLEEAIGGYVSVTVTDGADTTLTTSNGSADQSRNMVINLTGALTATRNVICPAIEKLYVVKNATTGGQSVVFKVSGQTGVTVPNGTIEFLYVDGTDARTITGSIASQDSNSVSITGGSLSNVSVVANASSLSVRDADASHILSIAVGSNLTANTILTLTTGATSNRTLDISASNVTISTAGAALIDDASSSAQRTTLGLGTGDSPTFTGFTLTGVGAFSAGTALLPSLIPSGDTNTGVWFPAADTIAASTGGLERIRILSTGYVGIGLTNPNSPLEVSSPPSGIVNGDNRHLVAFKSNTTNGLDGGVLIQSFLPRLVLNDESSGHGWTDLRVDSDGLIFGYGANTNLFSRTGEYMRITGAGNLGLGTSTFGTSAAKVFSIGTGTAPTTGPADTIQIYSTDLSAGNTMLSLYTEGTVVNANTTAAATHRIAIRVNGTVYYLLANTAA